MFRYVSPPGIVLLHDDCSRFITCRATNFPTRDGRASLAPVHLFPHTVQTITANRSDLVIACDPGGCLPLAPQPLDRSYRLASRQACNTKALNGSWIVAKFVERSIQSIVNIAQPVVVIREQAVSILAADKNVSGGQLSDSY